MSLRLIAPLAAALVLTVATAATSGTAFAQADMAAASPPVDATAEGATGELAFFKAQGYDSDFLQLIVQFAINLIVLITVVRFVYFRYSSDRNYLFSYFMVNILVFFICFTLKRFELQLGMALGLFAVFGILRYRTNAIPIKEMTYLFIVIGVAVINSLASDRVSLGELAFTNLVIVGAAALLESLPTFKSEVRESILYEKIDLIRPENHADLVADLQQRTGLNLSRVEMGEIDFLRDTVSIDLYYYPHEQPPRDDIGVTVTLRTDRAG
jgi:hypothetical protein